MSDCSSSDSDCGSPKYKSKSSIVNKKESSSNNLDDSEPESDEDAHEENDEFITDDEDEVNEEDVDLDDIDDDVSDNDELNEYEEDGDEEENNKQGGSNSKSISNKSLIKSSDQINYQDVVKNYDEDDDDDDDDDEQYLQKFDAEINKNYVIESHPECMQHNSDEIEQLSAVVRDSNNNIIDPFHKTMPFLTQYEKARCLGIRAVQIEHGAIPYIQVQEHIIDPYLIAEMELKQKKIPLIIKRPLPGGAFEYWKLTDLEIIT